MTASDVDQEALAAVRMANKMLAAERLTWGDILATVPRNVRVTITQEYKAADEWPEYKPVKRG